MIPCVASVTVAAPQESSGSGPWTGVIINSTCNYDQQFAELPECTQKNLPGAKLALYDDSARQVFQLEPQDQAVGHEGESVTITGTLDGQTIHVASLQIISSFGLAVGQDAPAFSARDQFGREQTLDTLRGPKGTVLLLFRSADW